MATLVLGTVGRVFGGPLGGIVGALVGGAVDRAVLGGGGSAREVGRQGNFAVQSAAYGEPIPFITGRMRCAGNLIWTSGITETAGHGGGGKRGESATTSYSYTASFAVALAARQIVGIERIWADGKLIRDASGTFTTPVTMRLHGGGEGQAVDSLIAAAEGAAGTPAYRGIAYAVFEDLALADFGNRIPNLTFEVVADAGGNVGAAIAALATVDGVALLAVDGGFPAVAGHFSGRTGSIAGALEPLLDMAGAMVASGDGLTICGRRGAVAVIPAGDCDAAAPGDRRQRERRTRLGGEAVVNAVEVAFYDTSRDYQPGLQRVRRGIAGSLDQQSVACAMTPLQAKTLAAELLAQRQASRLRATLRLPWRYLALRAGDLVALSDDPIIWRVREARFEGFVVALDIERVEVAVAPPATVDGGRPLVFDDGPAGPTVLRVLDLPPLSGELPGTPRLWLAASGTSAAWRRAGIEVSADDGASYTYCGVIEGGVVQGIAASRLGAGPADRWDRFATVDVNLLSDTIWLEGRTEASVLAGGNLALVGDEIIQFISAAALAPGKFRLSGLLRGRRGSEAAIAMHNAGERFVMLDVAALLAFNPPLEALRGRYRFRPVGSGDGAALPVVAIAGGAALLPLAPAHLRLVEAGGSVHASWIRRSRAGFGWADFVDAPLAEAGETYRVDVALDGRPVRSVTVSDSHFAYAPADRLADGGGVSVAISVAQISDSMGPGRASAASIILA